MGFEWYIRKFILQKYGSQNIVTAGGFGDPTDDYAFTVVVAR